MGYIRHQASVIVLLDNDTDAIVAIEAIHKEMIADSIVPNCIVGPVAGINGYVSYAFLPDGSKEGWGSSDRADEYRERFIGAAKKARFPQAATIQFGGDDGETRVLFTTDASLTAEEYVRVL